MQPIFDQPLETTPEDLFPILKKYVNQFMDQNPFFGGELDLEIMPEGKWVNIKFPGGSATTRELVPAARPENLNIKFYDRVIGTIQALQTSRYQSISNIKIWLLIKPEDDKVPDGLGGYHQSMFVMNYLKNRIIDQFTSNVQPNENEYELKLAKEAKNLHITPDRLKRWREIGEIKELTRVQIADRLGVCCETIKKDFRDMKNRGYTHTG